jgi:peptidyl-Lys metalloendopeptidase
MPKTVLLSLTFAACLFTSCWIKSHPPADARHPLECRMEAMRPQTAGGPTGIRFQLINRLDKPLWLLRWNTPYEGWRGTILSVSLQGQERPYHGPMVKRGDPVVGDYMRLRAGESQIIGIDLSQGYDMSKPGLYTVKVTGGIQDVIQDGTQPPRPRDHFQAVGLVCNELTLDVKKGTEIKINY